MLMYQVLVKKARESSPLLILYQIHWIINLDAQEILSFAINMLFL